MTKTPNSSAAGVESVETNGLGSFRKEIEMTHVYGLFRTGKEAPNFKVFASEKDAMNSGNGFNIVKEQSCLNDVRLFPTGFLVDLYNLKAERKISKFRDRTTAEKRVWQMLIEQGMLANVETLLDQKDDEQPNEKAQHFAKKDAKIKSADRRVFKDKTVCVKDGMSNPRRAGTHAYQSWELLSKSGPMLYQDFIAAGGRRPDFAYDLNNGWAEISD